MRFLLEAEKKEFNNFEDSVKNTRSEYKNKNWNKLNTSQRYEYARQTLKNMSNYKTLKLSENEIINYIMKNGWNTGTFKYLEKLGSNGDNIRLFPDTFNLISILIDTNKLDPNQFWLYDKELYQRDIADIKYSIEALTLASNPDLQKDSQGVNKFSDELLKPTNLYDKTHLMPVAQIRDRLNRWQTKDVEFKNTKTSANVIEETVTLLTSLGMDKKEALELARKVYTPGDSAEKMIAEILQNKKQKIKTYANEH